MKLITNNQFTKGVTKLSALALAFGMSLSISACGTNLPGALDKKDTLSLGLVLAPTNLDIRNTAGAAIEQILLDNVYEPIVTVDDQFQPKSSAVLEKAPEKSADGLDYKFTLKPNIKFSTGEAVTAEDYRRSIQQVIDSKLLNSKKLAKVVEITAPSDTELDIKLSAADPELLWNLSGRIGIAVPENMTADDFKTKAVGSGPFTLEEFDGSQKLILKKNPNYWNPEKVAKLNEVQVNYITDANAGLNALQSGQIDMLAPINQKLSRELLTNQKFKTVVGEGSDKFELAFNNKCPKLTLDVRQAIRYGINHDEFIESRGGADGKLSGPLTKLEPGYEDLSTSLFVHSTQVAKEMMAAAGYTADKPLELSLKYASDVYGKEIGEILTTQLKAINIDLKVISTDFPTWLQQVHNDKDYELSVVDNNDARAFGHWADPTYYYQFDNKEVQDLYKKSQSAAGEEESVELLKQAARKVSEEAAADWLFNYRTTTAMVANIQGFRPNFNQSRLPLAGVFYN